MLREAGKTTGPTRAVFAATRSGDSADDLRYANRTVASRPERLALLSVAHDLTTEAWANHDIERRGMPCAVAARRAVLRGFTVVLTWPLVTRLPSSSRTIPATPILNAWIIWWNAHAVPLTARWWNAPMFWPSTGALAFSEMLLGLAADHDADSMAGRQSRSRPTTSRFF